MKKVLVLAAAIALFATPALAGITGTKHDLSTTNAAATNYNGSSAEICVYCHTPHGADTTVNNAPLWNRTGINADTGKPYVGLDFNANKLGTYSFTKINASDAPLCLSCHDGASLNDPLNNAPNSDGGDNPSVDITGAALIGTDLSNDHPIGFNYDANLTAADTELATDPAGDSGGKIKFFGTSGTEMWCSSCHDVHSNSDAPFLNVTIGGSTLCKTCHKK